MLTNWPQVPALVLVWVLLQEQALPARVVGRPLQQYLPALPCRLLPAASSSMAARRRRLLPAWKPRLPRQPRFPRQGSRSSRFDPFVLLDPL